MLRRAFLSLFSLILGVVLVGCAVFIDDSEVYRALAKTDKAGRAEFYMMMSLIYSKGAAAEILAPEKSIPEKDMKKAMAEQGIDAQRQEHAFISCVRAVSRETSSDLLHILMKPMMIISLSPKEGQGELGKRCFEGLKGRWHFDLANKEAFQRITHDVLDRFLKDLPSEQEIEADIRKRLLFYAAIGRHTWGIEETRSIFETEPPGSDLQTWAVRQTEHYELPEADKLVLGLEPWKEKKYSCVAFSRMLDIGGSRYYEHLTGLLRKTQNPDIVISLARLAYCQRYGRFPDHVNVSEEATKLLHETIAILKKKAESNSKKLRLAARSGLTMLTGHWSWEKQNQPSDAPGKGAASP